MERVLVNVGLPLVGFTLAVSPVAAGEIEVDKLTGCVVPLTRETVTVEVVPLPCWTDPLDGLRLTLKSNWLLVDPKAPIWLITVFQFWKVELLRYSASSQNVDDAVGVGSVAAPK